MIKALTHRFVLIILLSIKCILFYSTPSLFCPIIFYSAMTFSFSFIFLPNIFFHFFFFAINFFQFFFLFLRKCFLSFFPILLIPPPPKKSCPSPRPVVHPGVHPSTFISFFSSPFLPEAFICWTPHPYENPGSTSARPSFLTKYYYEDPLFVSKLRPIWKF